MTDWGTTAEAKPDLEGRLPLYGCSSAAACIKAGNDLIMPGHQIDIDDITKALADGSLDRAKAVDCVARLITVLFNTIGMEA